MEVSAMRHGKPNLVMRGMLFGCLVLGWGCQSATEFEWSQDVRVASGATVRQLAGVWWSDPFEPILRIRTAGADAVRIAVPTGLLVVDARGVGDSLEVALCVGDTSMGCVGGSPSTFRLTMVDEDVLLGTLIGIDSEADQGRALVLERLSPGEVVRLSITRTSDRLVREATDWLVDTL